jgi:hypothetical protein
MRTREQIRDYSRAYQRGRRAAHRAVGLCLRCKQEAEPGHRLCAGHLAYFRARQAAYRDRRRADGRCYFCLRPVARGTPMCQVHLDYHRARKRGRARAA